MKPRIISLSLILLLAGSAQASVVTMVDPVGQEVKVSVELVSDSVKVDDHVEMVSVQLVNHSVKVGDRVEMVRTDVKVVPNPVLDARNLVRVNVHAVDSVMVVKRVNVDVF